MEKYSTLLFVFYFIGRRFLRLDHAYLNRTKGKNSSPEIKI